MAVETHDLIYNSREFIVIVPVIYISRFALFPLDDKDFFWSSVDILVA